MAPPPPPSTWASAVTNKASSVPKSRAPKSSPDVPDVPLTWHAAVSVRVELILPVTVAAWAWEANARPRPARKQYERFVRIGVSLRGYQSRVTLRVSR